MPTKRRRVSSTGVYHVTARGINKELIFNQIRERNYFMKILKKYIKQYDVKICAYCIMSNHIHLIIHSEIETLSLFMARVLAEYASYYNYKHERNGHVFQNRFGSECIETSQYFWNCVRYIHMNPVNAKMVIDACAYKFSSLREFQQRQPEIIHESTIKSWKDRFVNFNSFLEFHKGTDTYTFMDIAAELEMQRRNIAVIILKAMVESENVEKMVEILEDIALRKKYMQNLKNFLNISQKKTEKLYNHIKKSIMKK